MHCILLAALLLTPPDAPRAGVGPKPSAYPVSWEFEIRYLEPQRIEVQLSGRSEPDVYWYLVYTVINTTDGTRRFFPTFQLVSEDLRVYDTDVAIPSTVFDIIRERHKLTHPDLVSPSKAIGDLLAGVDYARESVAIWRNAEITGNQFTIFAAGLSGETTVLKNPNFDPQRPETKDVTLTDGRVIKIAINPRFFTLRKTLELVYDLPGSNVARQEVNPVPRSVRWVMR